MTKDIYETTYWRLNDIEGTNSEVLEHVLNMDISELELLNTYSDEEIKNTFTYFNDVGALENNDGVYDIRFMRIAREFSKWSKDPNMKVGCVAVRDRQVISQGYNGFPRGIKDDWRLYVKPLKLEMVVHAELNMVINAVNNGVNLKGSTAYIYGLPVCSSCVKPLIQSEVERIVMCDATGGNSKSWSINSETFKMTRLMLNEKGIQFNTMTKDMLGD